MQFYSLRLTVGSFPQTPSVGAPRLRTLFSSLFSARGSGASPPSNPLSLCDIPLSGGTPEPAALRLQNPGASRSSHRSSLPARWLMPLRFAPLLSPFTPGGTGEGVCFVTPFQPGHLHRVPRPIFRDDGRSLLRFSHLSSQFQGRRTQFASFFASLVPFSGTRGAVRYILPYSKGFGR